MGFSTVDAIVNAITVNGKMQRICFDKLLPSVTVANTPHSFWEAAGNPATGTFGAAGLANGRVTTSSTTGAMPYGNATGAATMHLITSGLTSKVASSTGTFILCDRITDCQTTLLQAAGSFTGVDATSRLAATTAPGDGGQLWVEVATAVGTATTKTLTYTDQLGNTAHTTPNIVSIASAIRGRSINAKLWQSLATGDTGVRSLDTIASNTGTGTGNVCYCIVRPLATIPVPVVSVYSERDFVVEMPNIPKLYDSSCLFFIYIPTAAVTASIFGELRICEN
jgi:hypothetical protein